MAANRKRTLPLQPAVPSQHAPGKPPAAASLLVLGMHRSGTSALTRVLSLLGAALPKELLAAGQENPRGFWESPAVIAANETILQLNGARWDEFMALPPEWRSDPDQTQALARLTELLRQETTDKALTVFKDPRICRLVPVWRAALDSLHIRPLPVLIVRHPLEIAASLQHRDNFLLSKGMLLWLQHFLLAERDTRDMPRAFVAYDRLLDEPLKVTDEVSQAFALEWPVPLTEAKAQIADFLTKDLHRRRVEGDAWKHDPIIIDWVQRVYQWSLQAINGEPVSPALLDEIHDKLNNAIVALQPLFGEAELRAKSDAASIAQWESTAATRQRELFAAQSHGLRLRASLDEAEAEAKATQQKYDTLSTRHTEDVAILQDALKDAAVLAETYVAEIGRLTELLQTSSARETSLEDSLAAARDNLLTQRQQLDQAEAELERAEAVKAALHDMRQQAEQLSARVGVLSEDIATLEAALAAEQAALAAEKAALAEEQARLGAEQARTSQLERQILAEQSAAAAQRARLAGHVGKLEAQIADLLATLAERQAAADDEQARLRAHLEQQEMTLAEREATLAQRDTELQAALEQAANFAQEIEAQKRAGQQIAATLEQLQVARAQEFRLLQNLLPSRQIDGSAGKPYNSGKHRLSMQPQIDRGSGVAMSQNFNALRVFLNKRKLREALLIAKQFELPFYLDQLGVADMPAWQAVAHYVDIGEKQGLDPTQQFSSSYYAAMNPDVAAAGCNYFAHWLRYGKAEGRPSSISLRKPEVKARNDDWSYRLERKDKPLAIDEAARETIDLIIPVYNRSDLVDKLFQSMHTADWAMVRRCIVIDDFSDNFTKQFLEGLAATDPKILLLRNEQNMGFLRSCNRAMRHVESDIFLLVNSDIQVRQGWLKRMVDPFADPKIALATPLATSGANLSVALRDGETWRDADQQLSAHTPSYPDACTAIGYCMAVRRAALADGPLFDDVYVHGYGEDTDLHYRLVDQGWRSVICDNLLIHHVGGASYILQADASAIIDGNRKIFFERWGAKHEAEHRVFVKRNDLNAILNSKRQLLDPVTAAPIDVLLVSPGNNRKYGGIKVIFELADHLSMRSMRGLVYSMNETLPRHTHDHEAVKPVFARRDIGTRAEAIGIVVATGVGTFAEASALAREYKSRLALLLQGPEHFFGNGEHFSALQEMCQQADMILTVSPYLSQLAASLGGRNIQEAALGPDDHVFYPRPVVRERAIAISCSQTTDKSFRFALPVAQELATRGWKINFFGDNTDNPALPRNLGVRHGQLTPQNLAKLFSSCQFYLDMSLFEGLGLLPLENAFCGSVPIMTPKGAPDLIFTDNVNAKFTPHLLDSVGIADLIDRMPQAERNRLAANGMELAKIRSAGIGYQQLTEALLSSLLQ